jgi:hypothetical protein
MATKQPPQLLEFRILPPRTGLRYSRGIGHPAATFFTSTQHLSAMFFRTFACGGAWLEPTAPSRWTARTCSVRNQPALGRIAYSKGGCAARLRLLRDGGLPPGVGTASVGQVEGPVPGPEHFDGGRVPRSLVQQLDVVTAHPEETYDFSRCPSTPGHSRARRGLRPIFKCGCPSRQLQTTAGRHGERHAVAQTFFQRWSHRNHRLTGKRAELHPRDFSGFGRGRAGVPVAPDHSAPFDGHSSN